MHNIFENNIHAIEKICKAYKVRSLSASGSVCSNSFKDDSDIDLLVSFEPMDHEEYKATLEKKETSRFTKKGLIQVA